MALTLDANDPDVGDTLTFAATVETEEYYLDQSIGLQLGPGGLFENWSGRLNEKWVLGDDGVTWYFITPDGNFWRWLGGDRDIAAHSELVASLAPASHADPSLLYDAERGEAVPASVSVEAETLTINPDPGFVGKFSVLVSVTDAGGLSDSRLISLDVTGSTAVAGGVPLAGDFGGEESAAESAESEWSILDLGFAETDSRGSAAVSDEEIASIDEAFSDVTEVDDLLAVGVTGGLEDELSSD
jgi:hypothetical protein